MTAPRVTVIQNPVRVTVENRAPKVYPGVRLPARLSDEALDARIAAHAAPRDTLNILDYGVVTGTATSQTTAVKAALDANPGRAFYFPPGDYRLDTGLAVTARNHLVLAPDARIYAGAAMDTLVAYSDPTDGYVEGRVLTGGTLDGNLNASKVLTIVGTLRANLSHMTIKDGINRGLVTAGGNGAELIAYDLGFVNTGTTNVADNIAIEANMGDSHFRDIIIRDWTGAVKDTAANRWQDIHPWLSIDGAFGANQMTARFPTSVAFDLTGPSSLIRCVSDTYRTGYKLRTAGGYTAPPRLLDCRAAIPASVISAAFLTANPATVFDNSDSVGAHVNVVRVAGHSGAATAATFISGGTTGMNVRGAIADGYVVDVADYVTGVRQGSTTFTPTLYGSTSAGAHTYTAQVGRMVVNGPEVTYYIRVTATLDATTAFAGVMRIGGIPIPVGAASVRDGAGTVGLCKNVQINNAVILGSPTPYVTLLHQLPTTNPAGGTNDYAGTGSSMVEVGIPNLAGNQNLRGKAVDIIVSVKTTIIAA